MIAKAKNPERVLDKVRECRFFLVHMDYYEKALDTEKFLYCLSAFMSAFRTIVFRLYGVTENRLGKAAEHRLKDQLYSHSEINFLIARTNVELHEDGVVVFQRFTVHASDPVPSVADRFGRDADRFGSRFGSRYGDGVVVRRAVGWQFAENSKNLIELCHDALEAMEGFIRQVLTTDPSTVRSVGNV